MSAMYPMHVAELVDRDGIPVGDLNAPRNC